MNDLQKRYALDQYDKHVRIVEIAKQIHANKNTVWAYIRSQRPKLPALEPYDYSKDYSPSFPGTQVFTVHSARYAADKCMQGYSYRVISESLVVGMHTINHLLHDIMKLEPHPAAEPFGEWIRKQEGLR